MDTPLTLKTEEVAGELDSVKQYVQTLDGLLDELTKPWLFPADYGNKAKRCLYCYGAIDLGGKSYWHQVHCPVTRSVGTRTPHLEE